MFDIGHHHETPEGVDLSVDFAGPIVRTLAFAIDFSIRAVVMIAVAIVTTILSTDSQLGMGFFLVFLFLLEWFYPLLFEYFRGGQTPGKKAMGIYVVSDDLTPLSFSSALIRNLLRAADFLPALYGFGFMSLLITGKFQRLGDLAAGTLVAHKDSEKIDSLPEGDQSLAPPVELTQEESTAVIEFYLRENQLSNSRQQELADIVGPKLGFEGNQKAEKIKLVGAWLLGARS